MLAPGHMNNEDANISQMAHTVTDLVQRALLTDVCMQQFFLPFLGREVSASQAAQEIGCSLHTMRIRKLLEVKLLVVARIERRPGRPIKYYRSRHDACFIPLDVTPFADLEEYVFPQLVPVLHQIAHGTNCNLQDRSMDGRCLLTVTSEDTVLEVNWPIELQPILDLSTKIVVLQTAHVELEAQVALVLQDELCDVFARYNPEQRAALLGFHSSRARRRACPTVNRAIFQPVQ